MKLLKLNIQLFASATKSTTLNASSGNYATLTASFTENSTSTANNTSNITCKASFTMQSGYYSQMATSYLRVYWHDDKTNVDTLKATTEVTGINRYETKEATATFNVEHKTDGTLSGYAKAVWEKGGSSSLVPNSGNVSTDNTTLTNIPRATNTPSVTASVGVAYTITLNPSSSTFTHRLRYTFGSLTNQTIATNVTNSYTWTMPNSFYGQIGATATKKTGTLYVDTYSGSTLIGTTSNTFTATVSASVAKPSVTISSVSDVNSVTTNLTGNNSKIVLNASTARVTFSVSSPSQANITKIVVNGKTLSSTSATTYDVSKPTSRSFVVTATDSRGMSNSYTYNVSTSNIINYTPLSVANATVKRTSDVTSNRATLKVSGNYTTVNFGSTSNALTLQYKVGSGSWTSLTPTISGTTYSNTTTLTNLAYTNSYTIYIKVTDKVNTTGITSTITLKRGTPIFWCDGESFNVEVTFNNRSLESRKKNFEDFDLNAVEVVKNGNIYKFNYDVEKDTDMKHYGFVIPDKGGNFKVPEEVLSQDKSSVELYAMCSILWEAMKEMINKNEQLENEIKTLKESEK